MKKTSLAIFFTSASVVLAALAGVRFPQLGSVTILGMLSVCTSLGYSVSRERRPILGRVTLVLWSVAALRILGFESMAATFRLSGFVAIWITLLLVFLATLHLCLLPMGMGVFRPIGRLFAARGGLAASGNKDLWYFNRIALTPLNQLFPVLVISCVSWGWAREHAIQAGLWLDPVAAISLGLLWPMAILTTKVFTLRPAGGTSAQRLGFVFDGMKVRPAAFAATTAVVYVYGLLLEFRSAKLYWLWSICFTSCLIAAICLGRLGGFLSRGSEVTPQQLVDEAGGVRTDPQGFVLALLMVLAFWMFYGWLLVFTFRPSFFAGID